MKFLRTIAMLLIFAMVLTATVACKGDATPTGSASSGSSSLTSASEDDDVVSAIIASSEDPAESGPASDGASSTTTSKPGTSSSAASVVKPTNAPEITPNPDDLEAELPKLTIPKNTVLICIDWDSISSWVVAWGKAFEACYPGITVKYKKALPAEKASKLAVWKSANLSPDAIYIKPEESWPTLINKDLVQPVDSMININEPFWGSVKAQMESLKVGGKMYTIVTDSMLYGSVVYKKSVLQNAGLKDPIDLFYENKWTWAVFEEYARKLTKINVEDDTKSKYGVFFHYAEPFIGSTGRDLIEYGSSGWVSNLNHPDIKNYITYLQNLGPTKNNYAITTDSDMTSVRSKTVSGQIGMFVTAEAPALEFPEEFRNGTLSFVPIPRLTSSAKYYHASTVNGFFIPDGASNPIGGLAYAASVRAMQIMDLDLPDSGIPPAYTPDQQYLLDYATKTVLGVPMQFRRLSDVVMYYNIYGPTFLSGDSYSGVVAEWEPQILEALKTQE